MNFPKLRNGLTLIELVISVAILVIVLGVGIRILNPAGQFAGARNKQRELHLNALINAIRQNIADNATASFTCATQIPTSTPLRMMATGTGAYNIAPCLVPTYIQALPYDPGTTTARYVSNTDYDTGYEIVRNASTGQITVSAPAAELSKVISITR